MRVAIVSDSHGDLVALEAILADVRRMAPDRVVIAGDIAQGGPQPVEVMDRLLGLGCPMVRGNSDDFLVRLAGEKALDSDLPAEVLARGRKSVELLGPERIQALAELPLSWNLRIPAFGTLTVVHATPWSNEDVVLATDASHVAERMLDEAAADALAYGHIHSPYQRQVGRRLLLSVGAVAGSNDTDPRPCYTVLDLDSEVWAEVRRVECPAEERLAAYEGAGFEVSEKSRRQLLRGGDWPVRAAAGRHRLR